ncbi:MAG: ABC transporter substrate-binding protein, partial [Hyphomicrobiaceae bacterium]
GRILGRDEAAGDYIAFYNAHLRRVTRRLAEASVVKPKVLIETYAGLSTCCRAPGRHGWAEFVELSGGQNLGAVAPAQAGGVLSMEYLLTQRPDIYIGNGGSYLQGKGLVIGPGYSTGEIREALRRLSARPGFSSLKAVKEGCVYGIWTVLAAQPVSILALEQIAKWLHPRLFSDLEPSATLAEINRRFMAVPMTGTYWLALDDSGCRR